MIDTLIFKDNEDIIIAENPEKEDDQQSDISF